MKTHMKLVWKVLRELDIDINDLPEEYFDDNLLPSVMSKDGKLFYWKNYLMFYPL